MNVERLKSLTDDITLAVDHLSRFLSNPNALQGLQNATLEDCADQLRDEATKLVSYAYRIEGQVPIPHSERTERAGRGRISRRLVGADGYIRPTWDRWNNKETEQRVRELRAGGASLRSIAELLGCSVGTVHRIVRKLGP